MSDGNGPRPEDRALDSIRSLIHTAARSGMASREKLGLALHAARRWRALEALRRERDPEVRARLEAELDRPWDPSARELEEWLGPEDGPGDERELAEWFATAVAAAPWIRDIRLVHFGSGPSSPRTLLRAETAGRGDMRLSITYGWDEEAEREFNVSFPDSRPERG